MIQNISHEKEYFNHIKCDLILNKQAGKSFNHSQGCVKQATVNSNWVPPPMFLIYKVVYEYFELAGRGNKLTPTMPCYLSI